jgi:hypothetical protein
MSWSSEHFSQREKLDRITPRRNVVHAGLDSLPFARLHVHRFLLPPNYHIASMLLIAASYQDLFHIEASIVNADWFSARYSPLTVTVAPYLSFWFQILCDIEDFGLGPAVVLLDPRVKRFADRSPKLFENLANITKSGPLSFNVAPWLEKSGSVSQALASVQKTLKAGKPIVHFFDGVGFESMPHAIVRVPGKPYGRTRVPRSSHNFSIELSWMIASERGCLTLFLFLRGDANLAIVRISDGVTSYENQDPFKFLNFPDIRLYAACWCDSQLLPGAKYELGVQRDIPPLMLGRDDLPYKLCCPLWKPERFSLEKVLVRGITFPSYFLTGCGFSDEIALSVMIAFQRSERVDTAVGLAVKSAPDADTFRAACLAYSNFTGYVLWLIQFLDGIKGGSPGPAFGIAIANLFGLMPLHHHKLTHATMVLIAQCYQLFPPRYAAERTNILSVLALALGAKQTMELTGIGRNDARMVQNLERWAKAVPSHVFAMQMPDILLTPQQAVRMVRATLRRPGISNLTGGLVGASPGGISVNITRPYWNWLEQTYLEPSIRF